MSNPRSNVASGSLSRRNFLKAAGISVTLGVTARAQARVDDDRPNLLFVFPDQFRSQAMGFMNADPVETPNIDAFASEAVVLRNAVSNQPVCSPYRAMLMTGQWPYSNGVLTNCNDGRPDTFLKPDAECFSDVLATAGYETGYIGKYHLDTPGEEDAKYGEGRRRDGVVWDAYTPPGPKRHGFKLWYSYGCCDKHLDPHYWVNDAPVSQPTDAGEWSVKHEADVAIRFIKNRAANMRDASKPFALFVAFNPPHPPCGMVPDEWKALYDDKTPESLMNRPNVEGKVGQNIVNDYFAAVTGVDHHFGRILSALEETGAKQNTVVVLTADHGEMLGSHGRTGKSCIYDEAFNIPFVLRYPEALAPNKSDSLHLNVPDVMPTLLGLMGLGEQVPESVQGTDRSPWLRDVNKAGRPDSTFFLRPSTDPDRGERGVRTDRYTLSVTKAANSSMKVTLFDRKTDPYQMRNIATEEPDVVRQLVEELNGWLARSGDAWHRIELP